MMDLLRRPQINVQLSSAYEQCAAIRRTSNQALRD
jgi:hypothetical protein